MEELMGKERAAMLACPLFSRDEAFVLEALAARVCRYQKGETLHAAGAAFAAFGVVLSGAVSVETTDLDGNRVLMAEVLPGESFGESLCYLALPAPPVAAVALCPAAVLWLRADALRAPAAGEDPRAAALRQRFTEMLARRTLAMNDRIQVLSKKTLEDKLMTYFSFCAYRAGARTFQIPFDREGLAAYLGVNRSALSRALSALQKRGVIAFYKNAIRLL